MDSDLERIGRTFEMSPHPTVICNKGGIVVYANRAASRFYPSTIARGDRARWSDVLQVRDLETGERIPENRYPMSLALTGKVVKALRLEVRDNSGGAKVKVSIEATPITDASGKIIGAISIHHIIGD